MEKAYDLKELGIKLKDRGLDIAEEALVIVAEEVFDFFEESAKLSETPYDDMALLILPQIKKMALEQIDKVDGEQG